MRFFFWLWLLYFLPSLLSSSNIDETRYLIVKNAESYIGIKEVGNNGGREVERFLMSVNLTKGYSWCAGFIRYILDISGAVYPKVRSGLAQKYITNKSIAAKHVAKGYIKIPKGYLVVWKKGNTYKGHIGIVRDNWHGNKGRTIEGNTSSGISGSQDNGDGVYPRTRQIISYKYFRIAFFTPAQ